MVGTYKEPTLSFLPVVTRYAEIISSLRENFFFFFFFCIKSRQWDLIYTVVYGAMPMHLIMHNL